MPGGRTFPYLCRIHTARSCEHVLGERYFKGSIGNNETIPKFNYTVNRLDADATTNLCKSVESVSTYIYRHRFHRFTLILPKVGVYKNLFFGTVPTTTNIHLMYIDINIK